MVKFAYNNAKNLSISYTPFKLICGYHLCVFFEEDINPRSQLELLDKLLAKL